MSKLKLFIIIVFPIISCNSQKTAKIEYKTYQDKETGWTAEYPTTWKEMTKEEIAKLEGRGLTAMEETIGDKMILTHKNLLWLKKDPFNSFTSNSDPYDTIENGPYKTNQELVNQTLIDTYKSQNLQFDVKFGSSKIDGLEFTTMETIIYTPDRSKVIMTQVIYDRLIKSSLSLTLNINYNNEKDKEILLKIISSSKLAKRE